MPAGRPSSYQSEFCQQVIELGKEGKSKAQIAANIDVDRNTLDNWAEKHPEFLRALTRARELSLAWWEDQGIKGIWSRDFNANAYRLQVTNRFPADWQDKQERVFQGPGGGPVQVETNDRDLARRIALALAQAE